MITGVLTLSTAGAKV